MNMEQNNSIVSEKTYIFFLILITLIVYIPALNAGYVWDDASTLTGNVQLRTIHGLWSIWTQPTKSALGEYWPLTHTSFWFEYRVWGIAAFGYHLDNIMLHILNVILILIILQRLAVPGAYLIAFIFALHPVHVESVAWVAERKNLLSGSFYLLSFLSYLSFCENHKRFNYYFALILFICAMFSKSITISLPIALLLCLWWKNNKLLKQDIFNILPFVIISVIMGGSYVYFYKLNHPMSSILSLPERVIISGRTLCFYFSKMIIPINLVPIYPRWEINSGSFWQYLYPATACVAVMVIWFLRKIIGIGPLVCVLFYIITLGPLLHIIDQPDYAQINYVNDHAQYLSSIGIICLFTAICSTINKKLGDLPHLVVSIGLSILLVTLGAMTFRMAGKYKDSETLFQYTLTKNPKAWPAYLNIGLSLTDQGKIEQASGYFYKVLELRPDNLDALNNLAYIYMHQGKYELAKSYLSEIIRVKPSDSDSYNNRGVIYAQQDKLDEAMDDFNKAIQIKPDNVEAYNNLGQCLNKRKRFKEAIQQFTKALEINPDYSSARDNLQKAQSILDSKVSPNN